jgi:hypothetical protein
MSATWPIHVMNEAGVILATHEMHAMLAHLATLSPDARNEVRPPNVPSHAPDQPPGPTIRDAQPPVARSLGQARAPNNVPRALRRRPSKPPLEKTMAEFACPS